MDSSLSSIIYISSATTLVLQSDIDFLLQNAVQRNLNNGISGILIHKDQSFLQIIEGDTTKIKNLYTKIENDRRHHHIFKLRETNIMQRIFKGYRSSFSVIQDQDELDQLSKYVAWIKLSENKNAQKAITILEQYIKNIKTT